MSQTTPPLISVIMPAYNAQATIGAAIAGVLTQTYPRVELIVVDDGSTDRTAQICAGYGDLIHYVHQENAGSSAARNRALAEARGDLIALCDADDELAPTYLEVMERTWRDAGGGRRFVTGAALLLTAAGTAHGRVLGATGFPRRSLQRLAILQRNFVTVFSVFPAEMAREVGGFAEDLGFNEDWDFWVRSVLAGWEVVHQPRPLALYRWAEGSKSTRTHEVAQASDELLRRAARTPGLTREERDYLGMRLQNEGTSEILARAADRVRAGRLREAREDYLLAARLNDTDRRLGLRVAAFAFVPGAMPLWAWRLRRIDTALARDRSAAR